MHPTPTNWQQRRKLEMLSVHKPEKKKITYRLEPSSTMQPPRPVTLHPREWIDTPEDRAETAAIIAKL